MGDSARLGSDEVVAFIDASEQDVAEVNGPDAVVHLLEAHGMLLECVREKEQPLLEPNRAGVRDALDKKMAGIFDRRQGAGVRALGRMVQRPRRPIAQGLVRPFVIIETAKGVESALLAQEAGLRRTTGFALESFVHPLVSTVLLWMRGQDALMLDTEPQPPDVETSKPVDAGGGEGHAVIGANGAGQPVLPKEPIENGVDAVALGGKHAVARQKIAGVLIGDREWVAINRVPRTEVALEVRRPEIVGLRGHDRDDAGMLPLPPAAALFHQAAAGQKISGRAHGGPVQRRLPRPQPGQEFGGAPARMLAPGPTNHPPDGAPGAMRATGRAAASILQFRPPPRFQASEAPV